MFPVLIYLRRLHKIRYSEIKKTRNLFHSVYRNVWLSHSTACNSKTPLCINDVSLDEYISRIQQEYVEISKSDSYLTASRYHELKPIITILEERHTVLGNISSLRELIESGDQDVSNMAKDEKRQLGDKLEELDNNLIEAILPHNKEDLFDSILLEVQAGVGGQEAMLFAQEMYDMYLGFIEYKGWHYEIIDYLKTDIGGLRHASVLVDGPMAFQYFKYEAGVHRVQRIPATEKAGRVHTSTVSVVALPQPSEIDITIEQKDLRIETKRSSGAGGQHVNTTDSAVRITHLPTNLVVECQVDRSQIKNRKLAMAKLRVLLYQKELDEQLAQTEATRKSQVRSSNRNEKIRTYNYSQDRITDHRLEGVHFHNLKVFLQGGNDLEDMIQQVNRQSKIDSLLKLIRNR